MYPFGLGRPGNFSTVRPDLSPVECETCREALSARLDGEQEPVPAEQTDAHLHDCAGCRAWQRDTVALTRILRVRPAVATPDLTERILDAAPTPNPRGWWPRVALAGVALAQLTLGLAQTLGVGTGMPTPAASPGDMSAHLLDESTAWNLALGLAMLWVALRARAAGGLLPVFGGFLAILTAFSVHDLMVGDATADRVASHGLLLVGFALVWLVHRSTNPGAPRSPGRTAPRGQADDESMSSAVTAPPRPRHRRPRLPLRLTSRHPAFGPLGSREARASGSQRAADGQRTPADRRHAA